MYLCALDCLPAVPKHLPPPTLDGNRFAEISDEEAEQIEIDWETGAERVAVDNEIRDAEKALWGNLGAVYGQQVSAQRGFAAARIATSDCAASSMTHGLSS